MVNRDVAIQICVEQATAREAGVIAGNGNSARSVAALCDGPSIFYMLGSMGMASSIAATCARAAAIPLLVIEGDGNALMGLSNLPSVSFAAPSTFVHVVLDNHLYESTGGQKTLMDRVDLAQVARCCSYRHTRHISDLPDLADGVAQGLDGSGPTLICVSTEPAGRQHPRVPHSPRQVRSRFESWLRVRSGRRPSDR
jgi:thiamine pyrophosphate-dependent acetolactate synthase large subunit-like protein